MFFKKKNKNIETPDKDTSRGNDDGVIILTKPAPLTCGGTDATLDTKAPKVISSDKMTFFSVFSSFTTVMVENVHITNKIEFFSAFAVPCGEGTFVFLEKEVGYRNNDSVISKWALVKKDIFPALVDLVREHDLAKENGFHSQTHGLPENFGGYIEAKYESGEKISISDNQSSIMRYKTGAAIVKLFDEALDGEKVSLPSVSDLKKILYSEERDSGFTNATLTILADGTAINEKKSNYGDDKTYESKKDVSRETVESIKENIEKCGLFAWEKLPPSDYAGGRVKTLTFVFADGSQIAVNNQRKLPSRINDGFFNIELELTTKN